MKGNADAALAPKPAGSIIRAELNIHDYEKSGNLFAPLVFN